ncbi:hypothetical protein F2Q70_00037010 [Brassica cretica]|uniref:Uncharacterized protein n=1 Tax=Brassica cretica TaxID=69181 RepID=A0A8S9GBK4_BRACR|nr:hypothetical protein F2Q68_00032351 [Brassica cretica]KAF2583856.1 hypothetical protein F2Q70_00037010 [Brassica cretica]
MATPLPLTSYSPISTSSSISHRSLEWLPSMEHRNHHLNVYCKGGCSSDSPWH